MDMSAKEITFDAYGVCNFCRQAEKSLKENENEIVEKLFNCKRIEEIGFDVLDDVSGVGIYLDDDGDEMEGGLSFRWSEDVDDNFKGEGGDDSEEMEVNGIKISYIGFNI
jgi:hypothetical protein